MKQNQMYSHVINTIMLITISTVTFLMPFFLFMKSSPWYADDKFQILLVYCLMIFNEIVFIIYSETVKVWCGNIGFAKSMKKIYHCFFKKKNGTKKLYIFMVALNLIAIILQFHLFKNFAMLLCNCIMLLIYGFSTSSFHLIILSKNRLYRKRDFLLFRPIPIITTPLCVAMFCVNGLKGSLSSFLLIAINFVVVFTYYLFLRKGKWMKNFEFTVMSIVIVILFIVVYIFFSSEIRGLIFKNLDTFFFAVCYSLYICLLYTLMYARIYPVRTPEFNQSIQKFQTYMFAFFPVIAFPLFLFLTDASPHLFAFGIINLIAYNSIGKNKFNKVFGVLLIICFLGVSSSTLVIRNYSIFSVKFDFSVEVIIASIVNIGAGIGGTLGSEWLLDKFQNLKSTTISNVLKLIRQPKYTASIGSSVTLLFLSIIFDLTIKNGLSFFVIYLYVIANLTITFARLILELREQN